MIMTNNDEYNSLKKCLFRRMQHKLVDFVRNKSKTVACTTLGDVTSMIKLDEEKLCFVNRQ